MDLYGNFSQWFWNPDVWLPPNVTWTDLTDSDNVKYAKFEDIYYALPLALLFCFVRLMLERFIYSPMGVYFGLKNTRSKKASENVVLEKAFKANGTVDYKSVQGLAKKIQWSDRQVERWFRLRKKQSRPITLKKFTESGWRFTYYISVLTYGLVFLWDKPWLWDSAHCWYGYPHHSTTDGIWWYYMIQMAFYWSLIVFQFFDTKRKDFWQMFVHHVVALLLLLFSFACNMTRVGSLVLVIHDFADVPLEAAKMAKYINKQRLCDSIFGFFTLTWFITRLGLFPYKVVYSTLYEAPTILPMFSAYYIFNSLLILLQLLHVLWSFMILRITVAAVAAGKIEKDMRSDDSDSSESENLSDSDGGLDTKRLNSKKEH